jgi:hypothetical protein
MNEQVKNQAQELGKHVLHLTINGKQFEWDHQYILGGEIRKLGCIALEDEIFLAIKKPWEDEPIPDDKQVNLARPEIEHFYSKAKTITLIINGKPKQWNEKTITFEQVVELAFGKQQENLNKQFTVTYDRGPHENEEGSMVKGEKVFVKNKMIFNVTCTDKS